MKAKDYPKQYERMSTLTARLREEHPAAFRPPELQGTALREGALSAKVKELIMLGAAVATHCDECIACIVHDALKVGATHEEVTAAIGIAGVMGGEPSVISGCEALEALEQFETAEKNASPVW